MGLGHTHEGDDAEEVSVLPQVGVVRPDNPRHVGEEQHDDGLGRAGGGATGRGRNVGWGWGWEHTGDWPLLMSVLLSSTIFGSRATVLQLRLVGLFCGLREARNSLPILVTDAWFVSFVLFRRMSSTRLSTRLSKYHSAAHET